MGKGRFCQVSDTAELEALIDRIIAEHPSDVEDFRKGNAKVRGFLMGKLRPVGGELQCLTRKAAGFPLFSFFTPMCFYVIET